VLTNPNCCPQHLLIYPEWQGRLREKSVAQRRRRHGRFAHKLEVDPTGWKLYFIDRKRTYLIRFGNQLIVFGVVAQHFDLPDMQSGLRVNSPVVQTSNEASSLRLNVYLLAENRLLRETLARLLQKRGGVSIGGVSRYTESAVEDILASRCAILLMDSMAIAEDMSLLADLSEKASEIKVVLFGMDDDSDLFLKSAYFGVSGYVLKEASASEIIAAVRAVAQGDAAWPPRLCMDLVRHLSHEYRMRAKLRVSPESVKYCLTARQLELMRLVERGLTNKEIAVNLNLSEFTVKNHIRRVMKEVEADDRHEAVDAIRASGLLPVASPLRSS
jgi:DNA-binding NarL/FixJ family response regulator